MDDNSFPNVDYDRIIEELQKNNDLLTQRLLEIESSPVLDTEWIIQNYKNQLEEERNASEKIRKENQMIKTANENLAKRLQELEVELDEFRRGATKTTKPINFEPNIINAAEKGDIESIKYILQTEPEKIQEVSFFGNHSALYYALKCNYFDVALELFKKKCFISDKDLMMLVNGNSLSYNAIINKQFELAKYLHHAGCPITPNDYHYFFFVEVCTKGNQAILEFIIKMNRSILFETEKGNSSIFLAIKNKLFQIADCLFSSGVRFRTVEYEMMSDFDEYQKQYIGEKMHFVQIKYIKGDYFSGILNNISENFKIDIISNGLVDISASSTHSGNINNVLQNNDSYWKSNNIKNSWIQFDFKSRLIYIKSYSLRSYRGPKSWKVEASNDLQNYSLIDERNRSNDFLFNQYINQHYYPKQSHQPFRYIRIIQGDEGGNEYQSTNSHFFYLTRIEFFGIMIDQ